MAKQLPGLGTKVKFTRLNKDNQPQDGEGHVLGTSMFDGFPKVMVREGEDRWNIDLYAINPTTEEREAYLTHLSAVRALAEKVNAEQRAMVDKGNAEIDALNIACLGQKIVFEE